MPGGSDGLDLLAFGAIEVRIQLFVELAYPFEAQT
jgi:hypothetical protein